jgi:hypothetical protein
MTRHPLTAAFVAAAALAGAASAAGQPAADAGSRQCFFSRNIRSWAEVDDRSLTIRVSGGKNYLLRLAGPCPELRGTQALGVKHLGGDWICTDQTFDLLVQNLSRTGPARCPVTSMTPISREEAAALSARRR